MIQNIDKIKELEKNQRLLSQNMIDAIWVLDVETMKFEYMTDSIEKISGYAPEEYLGQNAKERMTPQSLEKIIKILAEEVPRFEKGVKKVRAMEVEMIHKDKSLYWVVIKARLFKEPDGGLKVLGVTRDITERKNTENLNATLVKKFEKAMAVNRKLAKENQLLKSLLPVCSRCGKIRGRNGKWAGLKSHLENPDKKKKDPQICPDCDE